jgi:hypothetical protein
VRRFGAEVFYFGLYYVKSEKDGSRKGKMKKLYKNLSLVFVFAKKEVFLLRKILWRKKAIKKTEVEKRVF